MIIQLRKGKNPEFFVDFFIRTQSNQFLELFKCLNIVTLYFSLKNDPATNNWKQKTQEPIIIDTRLKVIMILICHNYQLNQVCDHFRKIKKIYLVWP